MGLWIDSGGKVYRTEPYTMECGPYRGERSFRGSSNISSLGKNFRTYYRK